MIAPDLLLHAYSSGCFPMAESRNGPISWFSPDPRAVIDLDAFSIPRSLRHILRDNVFNVRIDTAFEEVIRACADREETWISETIVTSYLQLHRLGYAHSVESWRLNRLAGGLYGVALGGAFFGESMFSRERDASKVALVHLVERLRLRGFSLLDTQWITPHLARFGAVEISRTRYLTLLKHALNRPASFV